MSTRAMRQGTHCDATPNKTSKKECATKHCNDCNVVWVEVVDRGGVVIGDARLVAAAAADCGQPQGRRRSRTSRAALIVVEVVVVAVAITTSGPASVAEVTPS
jgi:hypothetical protein